MVRLVVVALVLGFPVALLLSWAFDFTPSGIKRTDDIDEAKVPWVTIPNGPTPGSLRIQREWDPLRGDAGFEKLVNG